MLPDRPGVIDMIRLTARRAVFLATSAALAAGALPLRLSGQEYDILIRNGRGDPG